MFKFKPPKLNLSLFISTPNPVITTDEVDNGDGTMTKTTTIVETINVQEDINALQAQIDTKTAMLKVNPIKPSPVQKIQ